MSQKQSSGLVILCFIAFIALGMPDGLLGVAWPSIRGTFQLPLDALGILLISSVTGYLISSFSNGYLMSKLGVGKLLAGSTLLTGLALFGYTMSPAWPVFVALGFFAGAGAGGIDASLNNWVEAHMSQRIMQWLHASFGIGITTGPLIMTAGLRQTGSWRPGYWIVGGMQLLLGLFFLSQVHRWEGAPKAAHFEAQTSGGLELRSFSETLRQSKAWLSALLFFIYSGIELGMGHWAYTWLTEGLAVSTSLAGLWTAGYWATFTIGRILGGFATQCFSPAALLQGSLISTALTTLILAAIPVAPIKIIAILFLGFSIAPIFPSLISTTANRVGREHAGNTIGMQMAFAGLGVGLLPGFMGFIGKQIGLFSIPWMLVLWTSILIGLVVWFKKTTYKA
ncbi:MFS transporter [Gracilinema caldarium]|uniref:Major facilitator superfamily MFS_1 n=1 Tax=Gracilinema caldarium (strain ATCC 51460 / DSM 7334 / H1) TaxID=744872 RepID=F8EYE3_GRAC1|nr:MFS transporter [Gracilinema caldarium]AEJ18375.1 major facilitator superfamily MFS_1 [Gracilinema caldarium DSM 7334]